MTVRTVIVAEHDRDVGDLLSELLGYEGFSVRRGAPDQLSAREICEARPALALLDLLPSCPELTMALIEQLRADPATALLPVMVSTTDVRLLQELRPRLHGLGAITLVKPFSLEAMLALVSGAIDGAPTTQAA